MSSTDKTKFKITETSKQANVDITSDKVQLPADSADHTLVAKVPSAANCTSGVTVEVEMSPDGEKWCAAQRKTISAGQTTQQVIGNQFATQLDPNTTNKHARGVMNRDLTTDQGYAGSEQNEAIRTDAADFMHHKMGVDKSFNYSQWFKTSEAPTTTYKPVLFRHGGYDNFENAKTVELTDGGLPNSNAMQIPANTSSENPNVGVVESDTSYNTSPFYVSTDTTPTQDLPDSADGWATSFWFKVDTLGTGTGWRFNDILRLEFSNGDHFIVRTLHHSGDPTNQRKIRLLYRNAALSQTTQVEYATGTSWVTGWHQFVITSKGEGTNGLLETSTTNADNDLKLFLDGTELTPATASSGYTLNSSSNLSISKLTIGMRATTSWGSTNDIFNIDELAFYKGEVNVSSLYTNRKDVQQAILPEGTVLTALWRMGDTTNDVTSPAANISIRNAISTNDSRLIDNPIYSTLKPTFVTLTAADDPFEAKITQNLTEQIDSSNTKYVRTPGNTPAEGMYSQTTFTNNKGWFPTYDDSTRSGGTVHWWTQTDSAISFWHKGDKTQSHHQIIMYQFYHDHGAPFHSTYDTWEGQFYIYFYANELYVQRANRDYQRSGSWGAGGWKKFGVGNANSTDWHHYVINIPQNASLYTAITNSTLSINAGNTTVVTPNTNTQAGSFDPDSAALTVVNAGVLPRIPSTSSTPNTWSNVGTTQYSADIDEISTWRKSLTSQEISEIYNLGDYFDVMDSSCASYLERHIRCGDEAGDGASLYDAVSGTSFLDSHNGTDLTYTHNSSDSIYYQGGAKSGNIFTTTSNLSISGWFKTTDTGVLFSNTGGAAATGMKMEVNQSYMTLSLLNASQSISVSSDVNEGNWHHIVMTKPSGTSPTFKVYIDGSEVTSTQATNISNDDLKGSNGFTLLGDGQNNAHVTSPSNTDSSKLQATLSNWSLHSEVLDANAVKQLYSNGHVRNIKNLPSVTASSIEAWWQLSDTTNPQNDLVGSNHLQYSKPVIENANTKFISGPSSSSGSLPFAVELVGEQSWFPSLNTGGSNTMPGLHDAWTFSFWFNPSAVGPHTNTIWQLVTDLPSFTNAGYSFRRETGTAYYWLMVRYPDPNTGGTRWLQSRITTTLTNGVWYYLTFVKSSGFSTGSNSHPFTIYINGSPASVSIDGTNHGTANPSSTLFDNQSISGSGLLKNGHSSMKVGDIVTFNKALSSQEVADLYANHNQPTQVTSIAANIDARFRMGDGPQDILGTNWRAYDTTDLTPTTYLQNSDTTLYPAPLVSHLTSDPPYEAGTVVNNTNLNTRLVDADGATLVEDSINGNALTLSLTKSFNFTTNQWVSTADQDTALCLSLNGFEEQAEYFALWKCSQPNLPTDSPTETIDICDGNWHNVILSYRGLEDFVGDTVQEGDIVKFGNNNANNPFHWTVSYDGYPLSGINNEIGADYIGGLNTVEAGNVGFAIYNRHLKFQTSNNEEVYKPHTQFSSGELGTTSSNYYKYGFKGYVDETSFHSDTWWVNQDASLITPSSFDQEKPYTLFGRTTALNNRGSGTGYPQGTPYPLSQPSLIESSRGTNQWINPYPIGVTQEDNNVSVGGLEAWYRWGDTAGDCSINVFDVRSSTESLSSLETRSLNVEGVTDVDVFALTSSDSIYLEDQAATTGGGISYVNFTIQDLATAIGSATCTVKDFGTSILQYLRIKLTGSGTCDIGEGKLEIEVNHKKRRMK